MKASELREMSAEALEKEVESRKRELLDIRCQVSLGEDIRPHQLKTLRREIARINTVLTEKEANVSGDVK